jgi:hypothetical protein
MDSSKYIFQNMLFNQVNTGSKFLDYILNFIIISIMTIFFQKIRFKNIKNIIVDNFNYFFKSPYLVEIIIEADTVLYDRGGIKLSKLQYSKAFQAIIYKIQKIKPLDIYSKRESDKNEKNSSIFDMFIPDQYDSFYLDAEKKIQCWIKLSKDNDDSEEKDKKLPKKNHIIKLFSENKNTSIYNIEDFIENCLKEYNKYIEEQTIKDQYYFSFNYSEDNDLNFSEKIFNTNRTFNSVFFENKENYVKTIEFFINNEAWYKNKGIPYHYGILLHGNPGCGKTSIIKATLEYTKRHAIVVPLNRVKTCGELESIFFKNEINGKNIPTEKRIYIFEDIDCLCDVIKERDEEEKNIKKKDDDIKNSFEFLMKLTDTSIKKSNNPDDELNLSCLLNIFDGILETPGRIIILTSNFPQKIDKALLRPGRIDFNMELKKASLKIIKEIIIYFYDLPNNEINNIDELFKHYENDYTLTPAKIMNICQNNIYDHSKAINDIRKLLKLNSIQ